MTHEYAILDSASLIFVKTTGTISLAQIVQSGKDLQCIAQNHGFEKILIDHRAISFSAGIAELYTLPAVFKSFGFACSHRVAVLYSKLNNGDWYHQFLEAVANEQSFNVQMFEKTEEALFWLAVPPSVMNDISCWEKMLAVV